MKERGGGTRGGRGKEGEKRKKDSGFSRPVNI